MWAENGTLSGMYKQFNDLQNLCTVPISWATYRVRCREKLSTGASRACFRLRLTHQNGQAVEGGFLTELNEIKDLQGESTSSRNKLPDSAKPRSRRYWQGCVTLGGTLLALGAARAPRFGGLGARYPHFWEYLASWSDLKSRQGRQRHPHFEHGH